MSYFGKNIRKIRNVKKLSQQAFAELFDLKRATLGAYEEERSEPRIETIIRIANYFSITVDDLLTKELTINKLLKFKDDLALAGSFYNQQLAHIPCVFPQITFDYISNHENSHFVEDLPQLKLPVPPTPDLRAYVVSNLEMTQKNTGLFPNDIVIGELIDHLDPSSFGGDDLVVVLTEDKLILRKLYYDRQITLKAKNPNFEDIILDKKEIREVWKIKYVFYNRVPESEIDLKSKLSFLESEIKKLRDIM
ncbi:helix-turn-helix domain-containing protein [Robertkochia solimangrovi]|uniref:helix-turn-helix domain-containing protein n=1 Tax=Robertkochia solimangrovi TaxID=2213046 RepID=UPI00117D48E4|nr:helix-turn-helix transcriptional regulator [Robertkochia solimangrovi]TRZ43160.1 transcriptional regulator [Robertkochia solimangrovi]